MKYEILLFDLIGVFIKESNQVVQVLLGASRMSSKELLLYLTTSSAIKEFEMGKSSSQEFGENVVRDLNLSMSADQCLELWEKSIDRLYDGTEILLTELSQVYRLGCFSNNNEIWSHKIREQFGLARLFDDFFLSHELGLRKPDLAAFEYVTQQLNVEPHRIAFFDDLEENVMAAQEVGMNAFVTKGLPEVREQLTLLGVL